MRFLFTDSNISAHLTELGARGVAKAESGSFAAATPVKTTGLSPALVALLEGREV